MVTYCTIDLRYINELMAFALYSQTDIWEANVENEETEHTDDTQVPATTAESVPEASELKEVEEDASPGNNSNNFKSHPWKASKIHNKS